MFDRLEFIIICIVAFWVVVALIGGTILGAFLYHYFAQ